MIRVLFYILILLSSCTLSNTIQKNATANKEPEAFGFDSEVLSEMIRMIKKEDLNVNSLVIQRNNSTVLDAHFYPQKPEYLHDVASITKSLTSLLVGIAIDQGFIKSVDQKVIDFFTDKESLFNTESKKAITIEHLLTMTSGICSGFFQGENMREEMKSSDTPLAAILSADLADVPGRQFSYCSAGVQLLSMIIESSSGMTMENFAVNHLFKPLGINDYRFGTDLSGYTNASGDCFITARDLAKVGQLILDEGVYDGRQIVSKHWIQQSTTDKSSPNGEESYGYLWWLRKDLGGLIEAQGRGGQRLIILPEKHIVIVMYGTGFEPGQLGGYIVEAMKADTVIARNEEGFQQLKEELQRIQAPTTAKSPKPIPEIAKEICAKEYQFTENSLGLTHFTVCASDPEASYLNLGLNIQKSNEIGDRKVPMGLNGQYKISNETRFETPMAARAEWLDEKTIFIDYNEFSNAHKYEMIIAFDGAHATFRIRDEADYGEATELIAKAKN